MEIKFQTNPKLKIEYSNYNVMIIIFLENNFINIFENKCLNKA